MDFVTTRDATRLTGLSTEPPREWTSRRALILPDVKPQGHGSPARYPSQIILLLRLAVILRVRLKLELQAHRDLFFELGVGLGRMSFLSLWGKSLYGGPRWGVIDQADVSITVEDCIMLRLAPHLQELSDSFSLPQACSAVAVSAFPSAQGGHPWSGV